MKTRAIIGRQCNGSDCRITPKASQAHPYIDRRKREPKGRRNISSLRAGFLALVSTVAAVFALSVLPGSPNESPSESLPAEILYTTHPTISINSNAQFNNTAYPSNGVVSGNGTAPDPYIIEGWNISASSAMGIRIYNTDKHFIIRDCYIHDGGWDYYGIYLQSCSNGTVSNNNMSYNNCGIGTYLTTRINIVNNSCYANENVDIYLANSNNNTISNNSCRNNEHIGIDLQASSGNTVTDNNCTRVGIGIYLMQSSTENFVYNNSCSFNKYTGIELQESSGNTVISNNCSNNEGVGFYFIMSSHGNTVSSNTINSNSMYGVVIQQSSSNTLSFNNISNNLYAIYFIQASSYNNLSWNRLFYNSDMGVYIQEGSFNRFWNNTFAGNGGGQAYDSGLSNWWNTSGSPHGYGNYWSDLTAPDSNLDGIVDWSYNLTGSSGAKDYYPRTTPPVPIPEFPGMPLVVVAGLGIVLLFGGLRRRRIRLSP